MNNKILHTLGMVSCVLMLIALFVVHHKAFLNSNVSAQNHSLFVRMIFGLFFSFPLVISFLGLIYLILTWSPKILKAAHDSVIINTMSNLSFCIYMVHYCVLETDQLMTTHRYTFYFYDIIGFWSAHLVYTMFLAVLLALLVELPCASLWRSYADSRFLSGTPRKKEEVEKGSGENELRNLLLGKN